MKDFRQKTLFLTGLQLSVIVVVALFVIVWKYLVHQEATDYGVRFVNRINAIVRNVDTETKHTFTPEVYQRFHGKELAKMSLTQDPDIKSYVDKIGKIILNDDPFMLLYSNCGSSDNVDCYQHFRDNPPNREGYDPKSRPWYFAARAHTDWVVVYYMSRGWSRKSGYPTVWGISLVKRLILDPEEQKSFESKLKNPESFSKDLSDQEGIWVLFTFQSSNFLVDQKIQSENISDQGFLSMITGGHAEKFKNFKLSLKTLRFSDDVLYGNKELLVKCDAITDISGLTYEAIIPCSVNGEKIQFRFTKKYDDYSHLILLGLASLFLLYGAYRFFKYVNELQMQNIQKSLDLEKGRLINDVGARLVHDLKKGIVTQLNTLQQDYATDLELESAQPDFIERLKNRLGSHFRSLGLLNKYMNLLSNNLKRKKESSWIILSSQKLAEYLTWVMGPVPIKSEVSDLGFLGFQIKVPEDGGQNSVPVELIQSQKEFVSFWVPEISFYRILKNIWENYCAYGSGDFVMNICVKESTIKIEALNSKKPEGDSKSGSTNLGMLIMKQLLEDNFGADSRVVSDESYDRFKLEIDFPKVVDKK